MDVLAHLHCAVHTEVNAQCDELSQLIGRTSTVARMINLVRPTAVASLSQSPTFVELR